MSYQQYQQPQFTSTSTQGVYWNGSAWVSSASSTVCVSSVSSTSSATPSGGTNSIFVSELNAAPYPVNTGYRGQTQTQTQKSLVELYTEYYHGWQACLKDYERLQQHSADRQQRIDWARYYADESSRAAHYYYEQSTRGIINPPPPPFDLPPAPPPSTTTTTTMSSSSSSTTSQTHIASTKYPISLSHSVSSTTTQDSHTPGSLTHYVQRCLQPCNTVEQRTQVQAQVEKVIAQAIRDGNLHTKNWNLEPLLSIPSDSHYQSYSDSYNDSCSYYGPVSIPSSDTHPFSSCTPSSLSTHLPQSRENVSTPNKTQKRFSLTKLPQKKRQKHNSTNTNSSVDDNGLDSSTKALQKRQERFSGPGGLMESTGISTTTEIDYGKYMGIRIIGQGQPLNDQDYERMTVKGTCTTLEKEYLRLTAPPRAELVRPEHILKQHLQSLKQDYYNDKNHDYLWFCSQLKAVRQDLTIQRIQNDFAIDVYEAHSRIALLEGDLNEFNQCQTQLIELYDTVTGRHPDEFVAYRLLYHVFLTVTTNDKYEAASLEITKLLGHVTGPAMEHALQVRHAVALSDYFQFFRLHETVPNLGSCLTLCMAQTMRLRALKRITKAFRPSLDLTVCGDWLGLGCIEDCKRWITSCGGKTNETMFLTKESDGAIHEPREAKRNSLI